MTTSPHNRRVRDFFEQRASVYAFEINPWITRKRAEFIRRVACGRTLDVGVGPGQLAHLYRSTPGDGVEILSLVACDVSFNMAKLARERVPQARVVVCDAEHLPFQRGIFDTVIASEVIYLLEDPRSFLRDVRSVLAPGGRMILMWGNRRLNFLYRFAAIVGLRANDPFGLRTSSRADVLEMVAAEFTPCRVELHGIGLPLRVTELVGALYRMSPVIAMIAEVRR